jgi:PRC-barrel domain
MIKHTLTAAAFAAILASPAFAQVNKPDTAPPNSMPNLSTVEHRTFVQNQHATDWRGSKLIGAVVYGPDNASIGSVNDVLIGNDSKVRAVVIGVGGFLGVGEKNVAVPLEALNITRKPDSNAIDKISVTYTKDELKNAPQFAYDEGSKMQTTGSSATDTIKSLNPLNDPKK